MKSYKAKDYIDRLTNYSDKSYTRIVATKAVEISIKEISEQIETLLELNDIDRIKNEISEIINE
jgi:hypothetical protein